jgi:hypothetical protein
VRIWLTDDQHLLQRVQQTPPTEYGVFAPGFPSTSCTRLTQRVQPGITTSAPSKAWEFPGAVLLHREDVTGPAVTVADLDHDKLSEPSAGRGRLEFGLLDLERAIGQRQLHLAAVDAK